MGPVSRALIVMVIGLAAIPAHADRSDRVERWGPIIAEASLRFGVPQRWITDVMRAESGGTSEIDGRPIRSRVGAIGLMQLMPATWAELRKAYRLGIDPDDPHDNIIAGAAYLRLLYDRFGYPGLFAAYNAGPTRYALSLGGRSNLPGETIAYLRAVTGIGSGPKLAAHTASGDSLFVSAAARKPQSGQGPVPLFVPLTTSAPSP
jgi:soluble lytic murein transglycosylase-like protein